MCSIPRSVLWRKCQQSLVLGWRDVEGRQAHHDAVANVFWDCVLSCVSFVVHSDDGSGVLSVHHEASARVSVAVVVGEDVLHERGDGYLVIHGCRVPCFFMRMVRMREG